MVSYLRLSGVHQESGGESVLGDRQTPKQPSLKNNSRSVALQQPQTGGLVTVKDCWRVGSACSHRGSYSDVMVNGGMATCGEERERRCNMVMYGLTRTGGEDRSSLESIREKYKFAHGTVRGTALSAVLCYEGILVDGMGLDGESW
jgi:hypothetical protein